MTNRFGSMVAWLRQNRAKAITLAVIALVVVWFLWPEGSEPPPTPTTATVERGDIEEVIAAAGTLAAGSEVDVGAQVSGQLQKLHVQLGDTVSEGGLLAEIDDLIQRTRADSVEANLESLEAGLPAVEAGLALARGDLERQERLMAAQATTEVEYDRAVLSLAQAEANLARHLLQIEQAQASVEEAEALLDFTRITAPSAGTVVSVFAQEGQTLNATQTAPTIVRLGDLRTIVVSAQVSEADMRRLRVGMDAYFTTPADGERRWPGRLKEISPIPKAPGVNAGLAQFGAIVEVDNPDGALLPGMTAKVFFVATAARDVLKVPLGAVTFADGPMSAAGQFALQAGQAAGGPRGQAPGAASPASSAAERARGTDPEAYSDAPGQAATVQVQGSDGILVTRAVRVGTSNDVEVEVLSGLVEGERVVTGTPQPPMPQMPPFFF
ncbi:efflux RND transporter periplasmic adaptor subunit [Candidatus Foliamicus sp.]